MMSPSGQQDHVLYMGVSHIIYYSLVKMSTILRVSSMCVLEPKGI